MEKHSLPVLSIRWDNEVIGEDLAQQCSRHGEDRTVDPIAPFSITSSMQKTRRDKMDGGINIE
jgi:hypothetical protein